MSQPKQTSSGRSWLRIALYGLAVIPGIAASWYSIRVMAQTASSEPVVDVEVDALSPEPMVVEHSASGISMVSEPQFAAEVFVPESATVAASDGGFDEAMMDDIPQPNSPGQELDGFAMPPQEPIKPIAIKSKPPQRRKVSISTFDDDAPSPSPESDSNGDADHALRSRPSPSRDEVEASTASTKTVASVDFDAQQNNFRNQLTQLKRRVERLEQKIQQRESQRSQMIEKIKQQPLSDRTPGPGSPDERLPKDDQLDRDGFGSDDLPFLDGVDKPEMTKGFDSARFEPLPNPSPKSLSFESFGAPAVPSVPASNSPNAAIDTITRLLIVKLHEINTMNASAEKRETLPDNVRQELESLAAEYTIICGQLDAQRKLTELKLQTLAKRKAQIEQARKSLNSADIGGVAIQAVEAEMTRITVDEDAIKKKLEVLNDKKLMPHGRVLKSKHLDQIKQSGNDFFDDTPPGNRTSSRDSNAYKDDLGLAPDSF